MAAGRAVHALISGHAARNVAATGPEVATTFVAGSLVTARRTIEATAERCTKEAHGAYTIKPELLPNDASQSREQLVRRLGAKDSSIDVIGSGYPRPACRDGRRP